jgi:hypothetical protein
MSELFLRLLNLTQIEVIEYDVLIVCFSIISNTNLYLTFHLLAFSLASTCYFQIQMEASLKDLSRLRK